MNALLVLIIILVILMLLVAKKDGLRNLLGLAFNFMAIFALITLMAWGFPMLIVLPLFALIILALSIYMSTSEEVTANIAFKTSLWVLLGLILLALLVQYLGQFQGFAAEDVDELENLSLAVGLNFSSVAVAVMTISSLGAVAEAAMALVANLFEVMEQDEKMTLPQFQAQRKIISQQILGTAVNTLFFGVLGASVGLILWFVRLNYSLAMILNSKLLMADLASMLLGMLGILLTIWLAGFFVEQHFHQQLLQK